MHVLALTQGAQAFGRLVLVDHALGLFPDIELFLAHGEQDGDVLLGDDMPLAEARVLGDADDDLGHVVAEHVAHGVARVYKFHGKFLRLRPNLSGLTTM